MVDGTVETGGSAAGGGDTALDAAKARLCASIQSEVGKVLVGQEEMVRGLLVGLLTGGHVLLEGLPGLAKTLTVQSLASALDTGFSRIQFTPDMLPADVIGTQIYNQQDGTFRVKKGPIFSNLVLADEINRAPAKVQAALLEAMQERQVTIGGETFEMAEPFLVLATQNPIEQEGTYPLPEAQLDRFLIRTEIGYPGRDFEVELIMRRAGRRADRAVLNPVLTGSDILALQRRVEEVHISQPVAQYVVDLVEATRASQRTEAGASPRGSLALLKTSRARAAMAGRSHVLPDDVKAVAIPCLAHRLLLQPDQWVRGVRADQVVAEIVGQVPAPRAIDPGDQQSAPPRAAAGHGHPGLPQQPAHRPQPQPGYQAPHPQQQVPTAPPPSYQQAPVPQAGQPPQPGIRRPGP
ncbi:MAG: AAA family ATPase [Actinomycetota bacterium]